MSDLRPAAESSLIDRMNISQPDIERRLKYVAFAGDDAKRVASLADVILPAVDELTASFFDFLAPFDEAAGIVKNRATAETARRSKAEHLRAMVKGEYGVPYVEERLRLGMLYAKAGLDPRVFMGAFHHLMHEIGSRVMTRHRDAPSEGFERFSSLKKLGFFDIGLIVDVIIFERERTIRLQQDAIRELSTPVLQVRDRLLILPIIGVIDTQRARQLTEGLLRAIRTYRAKVAVLDITGVPIVDSKVANHLVQTVMAARLMGAVTIVTGLSAEVAQALVTLGADLGKLNTVGDLQGGLEEAERLLGYKVLRSQTDTPAPAERHDVAQRTK
jgi:rsbT co-antagonist protein RsbR